MPTLQVAIDASGAVIGGRMFEGAAGKVRQSATSMGGEIARADKKTSSLFKTLRTIMPMLTGAGMIYGSIRIIRGAVRAITEQDEALAQLRAGLKSTGGVSGQTMESLRALSDELQRTTTYSNDLVSASSAIMLSFTNIADDVFPRAMKSAADVATRMGTDLQSAVVQLSKALNDPIANLGALSRAGIQFSKDQKVLIKSLWETGQQAEAQRVILVELENQYEGSAAAARESLGGALKVLGNEMGDFTKAVVEQTGAGDAASKSVGALAWAFETWGWGLKNIGEVLIGTEQEAYNLSKAFTVQEMTVAATVRELDLYELALKDLAQAMVASSDMFAEETKLRLASAKATNKVLDALGAEIHMLRFGRDALLTRKLALAGATEAELELVRAMVKTKKEVEKRNEANKEAYRLEVELSALRKADGDAELARVIADDEFLQAFRRERRATRVQEDEDAAQVAIDSQKEVDKASRKSAEAAAQSWKNTSASIGASIGSAAEDMIMDFDSVGEATQRMLEQIMRALLQELVIKKMVSGITGILSGGGASVPTPAQIGMTGFQHGGVIDRPTQFPMSGGRTGVMGEGGTPEAVMPLTRDKSGNLGVSVEGGGAVQNFTFNIQTPDAESFRRSKGQILADIRSGASRLKG